MEERETIFGVLGELGRRLWMARAIRETAFAACVILFCLVCFRLILPALVTDATSAETAIRVALIAACIVVAVEVVMRVRHAVSTKEAAAEADARAHLRDELKSAHWFLSDSEISPYTQLQVRRAAGTAAGLDLVVLVPRKFPGNALLAAALGGVLAALLWISPQLSHSWEPRQDTVPAHLRESAGLHSLLQGAPQDAQIAKLEAALRKLEQTGASSAEKRQALADMRDAIDQANMEASAAREELARLAESLKADPKFESVAQAMNEGRMDDAKALLHKLKTDPAAGSPQNGAVEPADKSSASDTGDARAPEISGRDVGGKNAAVNQDAINRVISALEQANERIETQNRVNNVKRRMEDNLVATSQRSQLTASQFDNRTNAPNPTPSPDTGNSNLRGGTLFRQAVVAKEENDSGREGSQTGDASGDSAAFPLEGAATKRLDAQLKLEAILQKYDATDEPDGKGEQGWFYSASREQKSMLQAGDVRSPVRYDREGATDHDRVPMRQKAVVKNYFLNLHESEKK